MDPNKDNSHEDSEFEEHDVDFLAMVEEHCNTIPIDEEDQHEGEHGNKDHEDEDEQEDQPKEDIRPMVNKKQRLAKEVAKPSTAILAWPEDPQAYSETLVDKSYGLLSDLYIIQTLRQFIPLEEEKFTGAVTSAALLMKPLEQPIDVPAFLAKWTKRNPVRVLSASPNGASKQSCSVGRHARDGDWEAMVDVRKAQLSGGSKPWQKTHLGMYPNKVEAQQSADKFKIKMMLCGVKRAPKSKHEDLNFPLHSYYEEMAKPDVQYIDNYIFYADYLLTARAARSLIARGFVPVEGLHGVYRTCGGDENSSLVGAGPDASTGDRKRKRGQEDTPTNPAKYFMQLYVPSTGKRMGKIEGKGAPRHNTPLDAAADYDRELIRHGLFLRPGVTYHIPNLPLCNYIEELESFVQLKGRELSKTAQEISEVQQSLREIVSRATCSPQ